jgi:hypothetical protein
VTEDRGERLRDLRALVAKTDGTVHVHVHAEQSGEHRSFVISTPQIRRVRWLLSPITWGIAIAGMVSWVLLAVLASRLPAAYERIALLEADAVRIDTLETRLMDLQLRYDQVSRMLGAARDSGPLPPDSDSPAPRN